MKMNIIIVGLVILFVGATPVVKPKPFAVVELFTSEGCSSCPAADDLLKQMTTSFRSDGSEVIALSFHVTYWNKLGWEDPYSKESFTDRQKKYADALQAQSLYTPQAVINGTSEFVGSNEASFRKGVRDALARAPELYLEGSAKMDGGKILITYSADVIQPNSVLNIAIVETNVEHFVPRGENKSRTLHHFNIVKAFSSKELRLQGRIPMEFPQGLTSANGAVVLFVQDNTSLKIYGATQIAIN